MQSKCFNIKYSLAIAWAILFCGLVSCDSDDDGASSQVVLESFGPTGVKHGESIKFIGRNLDKVTSIEFVGVTVEKGSFSSQSSDLIELTVPTATEEGKVTLKTPDGDIVSKSILSFDVTVTVSSVPAEVKPGATMTITGEYVNWITEVWFKSDVVVEEFVSKSINELVFVVPMEAQTGPLTFITGGTEPQVIDDEIIVTLPTVTSVSPLSIKHTDQITITGTDLDLITSITFTGDQLTSEFVSKSETEIVVAVPVGALNGKLTLHQASPVDITSEEALTIILPKGTNLAPKPAIPGTDNITITGTNLDLVAELILVGVADPILASEFSSHTATQIVLALPEDATNGAINYKTIHGYSNNLSVSVLIPTEGPPPLDYYIYDDGLMNGWSKWNGWNTDVQDFASAEEVFDGTSSIKVTYNGQYGAIQLGSPSVGAFSGYTTFTFRIFAPAQQNFIIQIGNDADTYITIPAGWSEVNIPVANMGGNANVGELRFKNNNANLPVTLYIDYIGLKL
jgi:hypothetical protein